MTERHPQLRHLILVKHGETQENVRGIHQGRGIGGTLSSRGAADVHHVGRTLTEAGMSPERLLHSPQSRCRQSADILRTHFSQAQVAEDVRLDAKDSGHLSGLPREAAAQEAEQAQVPVHQLRAQGGESSEDVQDRYVALWRSELSLPSCTTVLLGHGGGFACLLLWLTGNGFDRYLDYVPGSGAVSLVELHESGPRLALVNVPAAGLGNALSVRTAP